jgi:SSS family solute:Na+ symporter
LYILSQFILQPYLINSALDKAEAAGISDTTTLAIVEAEAYPHYLDVMAILFVLNILIMLVIGKLYPRKVAYKQTYTQQVEINPWKFVNQVGIIIFILVVGIYIYFA